MTTPAEVRALREAGRHEDHLAAARALVAAHPDDVEAQIEAAYGHDRAGFERDAIRFYEAAQRLGVPADMRRSFCVGFGSTLRNVGRADDAVAVLAQAIADDPDYPPFHAFLALALLAAGHAPAALAAMLGCALDVARPGAFGRYDRALAEYHRELLGELAPPEQ
jgi:predicted Zn-dependent protease